uniref:Transcription initiation factor TFIID subunit 10 n=1 Tax=Lygus hesperus TaxID=30085 RepID=A0A0A9Y9I0_LYGHE
MSGKTPNIGGSRTSKGVKKVGNRKLQEEKTVQKASGNGGRKDKQNDKQKVYNKVKQDEERICRWLDEVQLSTPEHSITDIKKLLYNDYNTQLNYIRRLSSNTDKKLYYVAKLKVSDIPEK